MPWMPRKTHIANKIPPYDLSEAFKDFDYKDEKYGSLVRALRNIEAVRSINHDLSEARQAFDTASTTSFENRKDSVEDESAIITEALFVHAMMLYCRAVHSSSSARFKIDVVGKMNANEKSDHKYITKIRDTVIA
ncbi:hypothetical protein FV232_24765, partial [Methylobacterium sp. WL30]